MRKNVQIEDERAPFAYQLEQTQRSITLMREFFYLPTPFFVIIQNILIILFLAAIFVPFDDVEGADAYNIIIVLYVALWVVTIIVDQALVFYHNKLKAKGYINFNKRTLKFIHVPFVVWSAGMAIVAILFVFIPAGQHPIYYLQAIVSIEALIITISSLVYSVLCFKHNRKKELPDATRFLDNFDTNKNVEDKQAELIQYLQEQVAALGQENVRLHNAFETQQKQNENYEKNDLLLVIKTKEQDIRTLEAQCGEYRTRIEQFEQRELDEIENQYHQTLQKLQVLTDAAENAKKEAAKYQLLAEVEREALSDAQDEIELLKRQLVILTGQPLEEKTVYDI